MWTWQQQRARHNKTNHNWVGVVEYEVQNHFVGVRELDLLVVDLEQYTDDRKEQVDKEGEVATHQHRLLCRLDVSSRQSSLNNQLVRAIDTKV